MRTSKWINVINFECHGREPLERVIDRFALVESGWTVKPDEMIDDASVQGTTWIGSAAEMVCPSASAIDTDASARLLWDARKQPAFESSWADAKCPGEMVSGFWVCVELAPYKMGVTVPSLSVASRVGVDDTEHAALDRFVIRSSTFVIACRGVGNRTNASARTPFAVHADGRVLVGVAVRSANRASLRFARAFASFGSAATARANNATAAE
jgi:hypothetical protein